VNVRHVSIFNIFNDLSSTTHANARIDDFEIGGL